LTSAEARMLSDGNWEARAVCSRPLLKWLLRAIPAAAMLACAALFLIGESELARVLLALALGTGLIFTAPFLRVYTPSRSRVFRFAKWVILIGAFGAGVEARCNQVFLAPNLMSVAARVD
jgi:uncharacterized membrane protein YczE